MTVRDRATGTDKFRVPPRQQRGGFPALAFRPDGKELAYLDRGGLGVLELTTGKTRTITDPLKKDPEFVKQFGREGEDRAVTFTPDGRLLVAWLSGREFARVGGPRAVPRKVVVSDVTSGTTVNSFVAFEDILGVHLDFGAVAFSPDGRRLAASVNLLPVRTAALRADGSKPPPGEAKKWEEETAAAEVAFRPFAVVWDIASGKALRQVPAGGSRQRQVAFDRNGSRVAVGDGRRSVVFDSTSADPPEVREHHTAGVLGVAFGPDGALWTGAEDRRVCGAVPGTAELRDELRGCPNPVVRLAVSPDGSEVVAVTFDLIGVAGCLHRFEAGGRSREAWRFAGGERIGLVAAVAPDGSQVALLDAKLGPGEDFRFVIRDVRTGAERRAEKPGPWFPAVFRPDGGLVVYDSPKSLQIIDAAGRRVRELPLPTEGAGFEMPAIDCTPDGTVVVAAVGLSGSIPSPGKLSGQGLPRLRLATWDVASGRPGRTSDLDLAPVLPAGPVSANVMPLMCAASPDGRRAAASALLIVHSNGPATARLQGVVAVWDLASGAEVFRRVSDEPVRSVGFDQAGRLVMAGGSAAGGELTCLDLATRAEGLRLRGHARPILAAAFGPDGRVVTAGADRVVKVWDAATGREVLTLDGFAREVTHVRFTPDGRDLVAGSGIDVLMTLSNDSGGRGQVWAPGEVRLFRGGR